MLFRSGRFCRRNLGRRASGGKCQHHCGKQETRQHHRNDPARFPFRYLRRAAHGGMALDQARLGPPAKNGARNLYRAARRCQSACRTLEFLRNQLPRQSRRRYASPHVTASRRRIGAGSTENPLGLLFAGQQSLTSCLAASVRKPRRILCELKGSKRLRSLRFSC